MNISKWLNAVTIQTTDAAAIATINSFAFVKSTSGIAARIGHSQPVTIENSKTESNFLPIGASARTGNVEGDYYNYGTNSFNEIHLHNGEFLHNVGLRGKGMQIAVLDNGFNNYTSPTLPAFDSANANHQVLGGYDFVAHNSTVNDDGTHGMACFSTIVANIPGQFVGMAPQSNFWLFQTEDNSSEYPIEEFNWSCGAEAADSAGADVISTSLGYSTFDNSLLNHTYADMDGNTTMSAIAADLVRTYNSTTKTFTGLDGTGIGIAILDSGIMSGHSDFSDLLLLSRVAVPNRRPVVGGHRRSPGDDVRREIPG